MKMFIVDDKEENLYLLEALLTGKGYEVASAMDGVEALERLKEDSFDMIISDILMPKMDGFQLCRECKKDDMLKKIPFVFYTATYTEKKDEEFGLSLGAERYLLKPMEPGLLLEIIEDILENYKKDLLVPTELPVEKEEVVYLKEYSERLIKKLDRKVIQLEEANKALEQRTYDMGERIKELSCMYGLATSIRKRETLEEVFRDVVALIPPGWQYPEFTRARLRFDEAEYVSEPFEETEWKQSSDIIVGGERRGTVEAYYLESRPEADEGPFLKEERQLIDGITRALSEAIEHRRAEETLRESEERYRELSDSITDVFFAFDKDLKYTYWNKASEKLTGISAEDTIGKSLLDIFPETPQTRKAEKVYLEVLKTQQPRTFATEYQIGGKDFFFDISVYLSKDGISVFTKDITARKRAEEKIKRAAEEWRTTFDSISDFVSLHGKDYKVVRVNRAFADAVKMKPEELIGKHCYELFHGTKEPHPDCPYEQVQKTKKPATVEYFEPNFDMYLQATISPIINEEGECTGAVHVAKDITERKRAEEELQSSEERLKIMFESAPDGYFLFDIKGNIVDANKAAEELIGIKREEFVGKKVTKLNLLASGQIPEVIKNIANVFLGRFDGQLEYVLKRRDGTQVTVESRPAIIKIKGKTLALAIVRDTTARKQAEEALRESEKKFRNLIENAPVGIAITTPEDTLLEVNPALLDMLGYGSKEEIINLPVSSHWDESSERERFVELVNKGKARNFETRFKRKDGTVFWTSISSVGQVLKTGITQMINVVEDITERKQVEEALRESQEFAKNIIDSSLDMIVAVDNKRRITEFNHAAEDAFGYHREEVIGKHANLLYAEPKEGLAVHKQTVVSGHHVREILNRHRNGKTFPGLLSSSVLRDSSGEIVGVMGVSRDITERKLAEEELQKAHDKLEQRVEERTADLARSVSLLKTTIESTADGILAMDLDQNVKAFNQKCIELWKVPKSIVEDKDMDKLWAYVADQLADPQAFMTKIEELFSRPEEEDFGIFEFKDGRICEQYTTPQWMGEQIIGRVLSFRDITKRKRAEEELQQAKEKAEVATRAKSDFLASMSHELRTPLNAIIGFSEILSDKTFGELNEKQLKYTNHVLTSGRHLLALINDILDLSKVEAGKMVLERSTVAIKSLLEDSLVMIKEKAFKHGISLGLRVADELSDLKFQTDERKLKQIVFNLLSNAVKFTPDGGTITVEGRQKKDELIVAVSDTGIGIKHEDLERVFGEFEQVDSTYARQQQGTGLGLALTRRMVELHGGRIRAESEGEGKGSTFTFSIPIKTGKK